MTKITDNIKEAKLNVESATRSAVEVGYALGDAALALAHAEHEAGMLAGYQDEFDTPEEAADAKAELEEIQMYFDDSDDVARAAQKLEEWDDTGLEPYEVEEMVSKLEEYEELPLDIDELRDLIEEGSEDSDELKRTNAKLEEELARQANLIARLATALEEINTITTDELIGTGGA